MSVTHRLDNDNALVASRARRHAAPTRHVGLVDRWTIARDLGDDLVALAMAARVHRTLHAVWPRANPRAPPIRELVAIIRGVAADR